MDATGIVIKSIYQLSYGYPIIASKLIRIGIVAQEKEAK